jgi:hypothetical protein
MTGTGASLNALPSAPWSCIGWYGSRHSMADLGELGGHG